MNPTEKQIKNKPSIIKFADLDADLKEKLTDYPVKRQFDYIVIGAGITGTIVALELVRLEFKVLLIDKHRVAGGIAQSYQRKLNGVKYECEALTDYLPVNDSSWFLPSLKLFLTENNVEFYHPKLLLTIINKNMKFHDIANGGAKILGSIGQSNPLAKKGINEIIKIFDDCHNNMMKINNIGKKYKSAYDFLSHHLSDNKIALDFIENFNYFLRVPSHKTSAQHYIFNMSEYFKNGVYYPVAGFQDIVNKLVYEFELSGGYFLNKTLINKIDFKSSKKEIGSITSNFGYKFKAKEFVSAIPNNVLFGNLINSKEINNQFNDQLYQQEKNALSYSRVMLLLKDAPKGGFTHRGYIYLNEYELDHEQIYQAATVGEYEKLPLMIVNYHALGKKAPSEGETLSITFYDFIHHWKMCQDSDFKEYRKNKDYLIQKQKVANIVLKRVLKVFPDLKPLIGKIELATPYTIRRYIHSLNGNPYGHLSHPKLPWNLQSFYTPYKNLFLANASTFPGGTFLGRWKSAINCNQIILSSISKIKTQKQSQTVWKVDDDSEMNDHHIAEIVDGYSYLLHLVKSYYPVKKFIDLKLGLSFSKSEHYVLEFGNSKVIITVTTLEKANDARVYCWMPLPLFKDLVNKRTNVFKHTFQGTMRVKGGLKKFKRMIAVLNGQFLSNKQKNKQKNAPLLKVSKQTKSKKKK